MDYLENDLSIFNNITYVSPDPIIEINERYMNCKDPNKISLVIGVARDEDGKPIVFKAVREAELRSTEQGFSREYLGVLGDEEFNLAAQSLIFDSENEAVKENRVLSVQSISGSGSLRIGAEFIAEYIHKTIYVCDPTWANHFLIFASSGLKVVTYDYFNAKTNSLNIDEMINVLSNAELGASVLLHVSGHNPTGVDPTKEEWMRILNVIKERKLFTFFDLAYHGFISGDLFEDAYPIYLFQQHKMEFFIAQSLSKNMGLYGERVGCLHVVVNDSQFISNIKSQLERLALGVYLTPVGNGSRIAKIVILDKELHSSWIEELKIVVRRIINMREKLYDKLLEIKCPGNWDHVIEQKGMFSFTGLTADQCEYLIEKHKIFLTKNGRISLSGINSGNIEVIARAIKDTVENI